MIRFNQTAPANFRGAFDAVEGLLMKSSSEFASALVQVKTKSEILAEVATQATSAVIGTVLNSESTKGFKQHILREEDNEVKIYLKTSEVIFRSPSGESSTQYNTRSLQLPAQVSE